MYKLWKESAWAEYVGWQLTDRKILQRINALIKDIEINGVSKGIGKPEKLRHIKGWSRRIDDKNRLIYDVENNTLVLIACKGHYE